MKRTTIPGSGLSSYSLLSTRAALGARLGMTYNGKRDLYTALGYKRVLRYADFVTQFIRQDIAKAVIERPVKVTWSGPCSIIESNKEGQTSLEKDWLNLERTLNLKSKFIRLDKLTGLGRYGVLFMGFSDVKKPLDTINPVKGPVKLVYVRPLGESSATISTWVTDPKNPRYGLPLIYDISLDSPDGLSSSMLRVHYTRILHVVENAMESDVEGTPRLEAVFNRLQDIEKLTGGSAEMFWRGARPGYQGEVDKEFTLGQTEQDALDDQIEDYENDVRRILYMKGVKLGALESQVHDPKNHIDVQIQLISAVTGIPKRILSGSERGELSSAQDSAEWISYVQSRREEFAEPHIIRPFVDRMIEFGVLPNPIDGFDIEWQDLFSISEKDKVEIGKTRATALKEYFANPLATDAVPLKAFCEFFLGLTREQIQLITEMAENALNESTGDSDDDFEDVLVKELEKTPDQKYKRTVPVVRKN